MADPSPRRQRLVLVVDDDAAVLDSIRSLLSSADFLVSTANNAGQAILELGAQRPDVILTDIFMSDGDGFELLEALRSFREPVPVIAMSGKQVTFGTDHLGMAQRLGAVAVIEKTFLAERLIEVIRAAITASHQSKP